VLGRVREKVREREREEERVWERPKWGAGEKEREGGKREREKEENGEERGRKRKVGKIERKRPRSGQYDKFALSYLKVGFWGFAYRTTKVGGGTEFLAKGWR
jgi:hypothetical protein